MPSRPAWADELEHALLFLGTDIANAAEARPPVSLSPCLDPPPFFFCLSINQSLISPSLVPYVCMYSCLYPARSYPPTLPISRIESLPQRIVPSPLRARARQAGNARDERGGGGEGGRRRREEEEEEGGGRRRKRGRSGNGGGCVWWLKGWVGGWGWGGVGARSSLAKYMHIQCICNNRRSRVTQVRCVTRVTRATRGQCGRALWTLGSLDLERAARERA